MQNRYKVESAFGENRRKLHGALSPLLARQRFGIMLLGTVPRADAVGRRDYPGRGVRGSKYPGRLPIVRGSVETIFAIEVRKVRRESRVRPTWEVVQSANSA